MCALQSDAQNPAQFVFARREARGLLAFVVSDAGNWVNGERDEIERRVLAQGEAQLVVALQPVTTILEKRATFACTPGLVRPPQAVAPAGYTAFAPRASYALCFVPDGASCEALLIETINATRRSLRIQAVGPPPAGRMQLPVAPSQFCVSDSPSP